MTIGMQPIFTYTLTSDSAALGFRNIPGNYTDLVIKVSTRFTGVTTYYDLIASFDSASSVYSSTMAGNYNQRQSNAGYILCGNATGSLATANTFSNIEFYIPGYSSANFKSVIIDSVAENNGAGASLYPLACLYRSTAPITRLDFGTAGGGNFAAGTSVSIYGITKG